MKKGGAGNAMDGRLESWTTVSPPPLNTQHVLSNGSKKDGTKAVMISFTLRLL